MLNTLKEAPEHTGEAVTITGWIRTVRTQKNLTFLALNDGNQLDTLQVVIKNDHPKIGPQLEHLTTGSAISVTGTMKESPGGRQSVELQAEDITLIGPAPADYILQKKRHSFPFLRTIAHLRPRTNTFGAIARIKNHLAFATHTFFQERDFLYVQTPIITTSDCEGAGELFRVTTQNGEDFFGKPAFLTVSGQLNAEVYALSCKRAYTFGPTFRAENSNTSRHLAEFWMIEPEMAFCRLSEDMDLAEAYIKYLIKSTLEKRHDDLAFFDQFIEKGLIERLRLVLDTPCVRMSYTEAIEILEKSKVSFEFPVRWGVDLQSEHERYLTEVHCKGPILVYDYPKAIKPFYMRTNDDGKTVAAMDLLVPITGELIGGGEREERLEILQANMEAAELDLDIYDWYLDLRRYGGTPHAGFGLGFERLGQYMTGMENIRDIAAFPRYPDHAEF